MYKLYPKRTCRMQTEYSRVAGGGSDHVTFCFVFSKSSTKWRRKQLTDWRRIGKGPGFGEWLDTRTEPTHAHTHIHTLNEF